MHTTTRITHAGLNLDAGEQPSREVKEAVIQMRKAIVRAHEWKCCLNCMEWREETHTDATGAVTKRQFCGRYNAVPPPIVIVTGCVEYEQDIPF